MRLIKLTKITVNGHSDLGYRVFIRFLDRGSVSHLNLKLMFLLSEVDELIDTVIQLHVLLELVK